MKLTWLFVALLVLVIALSQTSHAAWNPEKPRERSQIAVIIPTESSELAAAQVASTVDRAHSPERLVFVIAHAAPPGDSDCLHPVRAALRRALRDPSLAEQIEIRVAVFEPSAQTPNMVAKMRTWVTPYETVVVIMPRASPSLTSFVPFCEAWDKKMAHELHTLGAHGIVLQISPTTLPSFARLLSHAGDELDFEWVPFANPPRDPLPTIAIAPPFALNANDFRTCSTETSSRYIDALQPSSFWSAKMAGRGLRMFASGNLHGSCDLNKMRKQPKAPWAPTTREEQELLNLWVRSIGSDKSMTLGLRDDSPSVERRFKWGSANQQSALRRLVS